MFTFFYEEGKWMPKGPCHGYLFPLSFGYPLNDTFNKACTDAENEKTSDEVLSVSEGLYQISMTNKASVSSVTAILVGLLHHRRPVTKRALSRIVLFFCYPSMFL